MEDIEVVAVAELDKEDLLWHIVLYRRIEFDKDLQQWVDWDIELDQDLELIQDKVEVELEVGLGVEAKGWVVVVEVEQFGMVVLGSNCWMDK